MPYTDAFKRKMVQKMTGPNAISASALSKQVDVSQTSLSTWLRNAGIDFSNNISINSTVDPRHLMAIKRPEDWSSEDKLKAVLEVASIPDDKLGGFLRKKGIHETHLQQWRVQMLNGLDKVTPATKPKRSKADIKKIKTLEKELNRKDKALAETAALLVLKKKVQDIWGDEDDETNRNNEK